MNPLAPTVPPIVRNQQAEWQELYSRHILPTYGRFELAIARGEGAWVWDTQGKRYLDLGGGIAVNCLGHAHPEVADALAAQARLLVHTSNLYFSGPQAHLASHLGRHLPPGKLFFCNSGAEANEGLFKLSRKFGAEQGRFEVITALQSFHGRTLAGIAATGQEKVKSGFYPMTPGFRHVPFNDLDAIDRAVSPATAAVLIEGVQGEGGITPASMHYLSGLRKLCTDRNLLLLLDGVQCGHFRTGRFQSYQRILEPLEPHHFEPDGISMAKSLGGGVPIGAFWIHERHAHLFGPGSHGTTYGGNLLACTVASKILEIIERDHLAENARSLGESLKASLEQLTQQFPAVLKSVRGLGLMIGIELAPADQIPAMAPLGKPSSTCFIHRLHDAGMLAVPSGSQTIRFLPPLNLTRDQANHGLQVLESVLQALQRA